ncbi:Solute carrier family 25 member 36 [Bos mutus]|uniref:Solute carrier family 25 member 36 n=1 Tax=Bos mutus TaxID=72004 RepID=L8IDV9_9CETA|nr:Solute carrier family 25 member 36 [Bos mutus]
MLQSERKLRHTPVARSASASASGGYAGERRRQKHRLVHLLAGGCGGAVGAILTCPLEVVKTAAVIFCDTLYLCSSAEHHDRSQGQWSSVSWTSPLSKVTNTIWLIKTRLQLDARNRGEKRMGVFQCVPEVYQTDGLRGFYRRMSASYAGISETVIHFAIYENIKQSYWNIPNTAIMMATYELVVYLLNGQHHQTAVL